MKKIFTAKQFRQLFIALVIFIPGLLLLFYMIVVEDEPGAIPLLLTFSGLIWIVRIVHHRNERPDLRS